TEVVAVAPADRDDRIVTGLAIELVGCGPAEDLVLVVPAIDDSRPTAGVEAVITVSTIDRSRGSHQLVDLDEVVARTGVADDLLNVALGERLHLPVNVHADLRPGGVERNGDLIGRWGAGHGQHTVGERNGIKATIFQN